MSSNAERQNQRKFGYRAAWDDCGGIGASATERMRMIAAKIKGWAKPLPFVRHAAQDCKSMVNKNAGLDKDSGEEEFGFHTTPGPGQQINYPGPEIPAAARAGLEKARATLEKYPATTVKPA